MAHLKSKSFLVGKLEKILARRFPAPATVKLEEHDGIIGIITSEEFARMDSFDRQDLIGEIISANLDPEERHQVQIIVAVTPDEETGYLAGVD